MDPDAALAYLDRHADDYGADFVERAEALRDWIRAGGFHPDWKRYPTGHSAFRTFLRTH